MQLMEEAIFARAECRQQAKARRSSAYQPEDNLDVRCEDGLRNASQRAPVPAQDGGGQRAGTSARTTVGGRARMKFASSFMMPSGASPECSTQALAAAQLLHSCCRRRQLNSWQRQRGGPPWPHRSSPPSCQPGQCLVWHLPSAAAGVPRAGRWASRDPVSCCLRRLLGLIHANFAGIAMVCCPVGSANPAASLRDQK